MAVGYGPGSESAYSLGNPDLQLEKQYAVRSGRGNPMSDAPSEALDPVKVAQALMEARKGMHDNRRNRVHLDAEYESLQATFQQLANDFVGWLERG